MRIFSDNGNDLHDLHALSLIVCTSSYVDNVTHLQSLAKLTVFASSTRLIVTAVNVMTSEPLVFDSFKIDIKPKHLLACSSYLVYGFPWVEVENIRIFLDIV